MKRIYSFIARIIPSMLCIPIMTLGQEVSTFEDFQLGKGSYWNGITSSYGQFTTNQEDSIFIFENHFSRSDFGFGLIKSWSGFAYSRMQDDTTAGFTNQYSSITAGGASGSENYAVYYLDQGKDTVWLKETARLDSVFITNGTYPYLSMKEGDMFAKKFGGETGDDPDWFLLTIRGLKDGITTDTIEFYLADFRYENNEEDYIIDDWTKVDLSVLDTIDMLEFSLSSSDTNEYGIKTPKYFCMDNLSGAGFDDLTYISGDYWNGETASFGSYHTLFTDGIASFPNVYTVNDYGYGPFESWTGFAYSNMQDDTTSGHTNQYSAYPAEGAQASSTYAFCYNSRGADTIKLSSPTELTGAYITNGTYGVLSMNNGDTFAKKFGGETGDDPDWFLLTIRGIHDGSYTDSVLFYLADYRFENNEKDYIVTDWEWVDLSNLGTVDMVEFSLSSSDVGDFGMNTPAYFFIDNFNGVVTNAGIETLMTGHIDVYPNPFTTYIQIHVENEVSSVRIMDISGKTVKIIQPNNKSKPLQIQLDDLQTGVYFLQINSLQNVITKRIIKK